MKGLAVRCAVVAALGVALVIFSSGSTSVTANNAADPDIKEVMKKVNSAGLCKAINEGVGNNKKIIVETPNWDDLAVKVKELVPLAKALGTNKPPMGSEESWKKHTTAYAKAAEDLEAAVKDKNVDKAKSAAAVIANCAGCHKEHRPMKKKNN